MEEKATYEKAQEAAGGKTYGELGKPPAIVARATGIAAPGERQPEADFTLYGKDLYN